MSEVSKLDQQINEQESNGSDNFDSILVPINKVLPNPNNPRKNDSIRTEEMQNIILSKGWEEPLIAYEKEGKYYLLSGHRRLFAARKAGIKQIPLYLREAPKSDAEELERLASLQSGRVDWDPLEWALFTKSRWEAWGKPPIAPFARKLGLNVSATSRYINVLEYFPLQEIEAGLTNKTYNFSSLEALVQWIKDLKKHKPDIDEDLGEELIRKTMLNKMAHGKVYRDSLKNREYLKRANSDDIRDFLLDKNMHLEKQIAHLGIQKRYQTFNGVMKSLDQLESSILTIKPETDHQKETMTEQLEKLIQTAQKQLEGIKGNK